MSQPQKTSWPWRPVAGALVLIVAIASIANGLLRADEQAAAVPVPAEASSADAVTVYYFHGETRCRTCLAIEAETLRVVQERFAEPLQQGALRIEVVNFETPEGQPFREAYDLAFSSVVVQAAGSQAPWLNLSEVWTLIHGDLAEFDTYITTHVDNMLRTPG